jgi:hypothetical protein
MAKLDHLKLVHDKFAHLLAVLPNLRRQLYNFCEILFIENWI